MHVQFHISFNYLSFFLTLLHLHEPGRLEQSGVSLAANQGVACLSPCPAIYYLGDLSCNNFYSHSPLPLIQEGQMYVSGESMCTKYWLTA